ncbi:PQQ-dependent sugar dehydrogenase [Lacibacter sp.]|uniref:PQQ-dependent sugar dehydrogenase n=1 Tax=Lacibacter sp. TaxID=1915409 RepID=UPI002B4B7EDA|nr:PQQ-dependent sugar dehydrogenase [Lacibacter sp.]HLP38614.1 PQQ-dependent sugar dehydrogenase [Lacibacter sp.]
MKRILFIAVLFVFAFYSFAQAPDACNTPLNLTPQTTCGATGSQTLQNSTATGSPINAAGTTKDVWYTFTTPSGITSVTITLSSPGNSIDDNSYIEAFSNGSCGSGTFSGTSLGTSAVTTGTGTSLSLSGLSASTLYHFRVFTTAANTTTGGAGNWQYSICVSYAPPLANDLCSTATNITPVTTCGATANQTLLNATTTGSPTNGAGTTRDVWYTFTTPANIRNVQIATSNLGGNLTTSNTYIEAFTASSCAAGVFTGTSIATTASGTSTLSLTNLTPSTQYYFRVFTTASATGGTTTDWGFSICVSYTAVPSNDDCAGALTLTPGTTNSTGSVLNATASGTTIGCATGTPDDDIWYKFTTTSTQTFATITVTAGATLSANGAMIQVYSGACGSLTSIACGQNEVTISSGLSVSTQYYIRVYSSSAYSTTPASGSVANNVSILVSAPLTTTNITAGKMNEVYRQTILSAANVLADPWEITYGPDNYLWVTEAKGYKLNRINPVTGAKQVVLDISQNSTFFSSPADQAFNCQFNNGTGAQGGFAGMALHPKFLDASSPQNYVYISYVHSNPSTAVFVNRIVRFFYNTSTNKLESPVSICDTIPGSQDHNSQRMIITPMTQGGSDYYLFYAAGDMGAGQQYPTLNITRPMKAQVINAYEGKILRFALSDTCSGTGNQKWIPDSNPYNNVAPIVGKSAVWNIGMRNNQGFAYNPALNILYGSSHGPYSDDEINIIEGFKNYGHPLVIGYVADGNYNGNVNTGTSTSISAGVPWSYGAATTASSTTPPIGNETTRMNEINANASLYGAYKDPLFSAYPGPASGTGSVAAIWGATSTPSNATWHSEGWSGLDIYTHTLIPGWKNSLLAAGLKWGRTIRLKLNDAGTAVVPVAGADTVTYFQSTNRYRDIAFAPNGKEIFLAMDRSNAASAATVGSPPATVGSCLGCVIKYEFLGYNPTGTSPFPSTIPTSIPIDSSTNAGCVTATAITINAENGNNNLWVPITGPNGNIIAEIDANNNNLGNITTSFFTRTGNPVRTGFGNKYLNRNVTINVENNPPATPVSVRLYLTAQELADMVATSGSGVTGIADLSVFKNNDPCGTTMASTALGQTVTGRYVQSTYGHAIQFDVTSFSSFYFMSSSSTLPFDLFSFTGKAVADNSRLEWVVNNEVDVISYTVERSLDNNTFEKIGTVDAKNIPATNLTYNFIDYNAGKLANKVYYRVHSNENNGTKKYTNIIDVSFGALQNVYVNVFPNPVAEKTTVTINAIADESAQLNVIDNTGRTIQTIEVNLVKGKNIVQLDLGTYKAGVYYLDINGKAINEKVKIIKQ